MANLSQHRGWISGIRLRAASTAVASVTVLLLGNVAIQSARAQTYKRAYAFKGAPDGALPFAGLVRDTAECNTDFLTAFLLSALCRDSGRERNKTAHSKAAATKSYLEIS